MFKSPRDTHQINFIGRQLNYKQFLKETYELAIKKQFCHLLFNLDPKTFDVLQYCSNFNPRGSSILYLPSASAVIANVAEELKREKELCMLQQMLNTSDSKVGKIIETSRSKIIKFEFLLNNVN